ncbi:hypothetical protein [Mycolicibacterium wolinskyi]|uniref:hypothetical protein n=1 Tax=Mycolicibacterium wolinskyi TaxID=59750 RepID=UPI0039179790
MLSAIAIVPAAPVIVPELMGGAAAEMAGLREAVLAAAGALPAHWLAVGVGPADAVLGPERAGTFAGYGVDVPVALSPDSEPAPTELPLCALIAGWIRGQTDARTVADVRVFADACPADAAVAHGRRLRAEIDESVDPVGVLVVADGANTLAPAAPGGYVPESVALQRDLDDALAGGDVAALTRVSDGIVGRVGYQVLAGLAEPGPRAARELYRGAPYGVGYFVGVWDPAGRSEATWGSIP